MRHFKIRCKANLLCLRNAYECIRLAHNLKGLTPDRYLLTLAYQHVLDIHW